MRLRYRAKHTGRNILNARSYNDSELEEKLFSELGCYYVPGADGITARAWLQSVAAQLLEGDFY